MRSTYYLIVPANGTPRVVQRYPNVVDKGWGAIAPGEIAVTVPDTVVPTPTVDVV